MRSSTWVRYVAACALIGAGAPAARAAVREIHQECVLVGCWPGDAGGFPVTISQPGEYRLTSNLNVSFSANPQNVTAIEITAADVDLDLNGFALVGITRCPGAPSPCSPTGTGHGVTSSNAGSSIHDGSVMGFGGAGLSLGDSFRAERLRVSHNGAEGIITYGTGGILTDSVVFSNKGDGVQTYRYAVVTGCTFTLNGHDGINGRQNTAVEESISWGNVRVGYWAEVDLQVHFSLAVANGNGGLSGFAYASVGANNGTYGITSGFPNDGSVLQSVFAGNGSGARASGVFTLGQNNCHGSVC